MWRPWVGNGEFCKSKSHFTLEMFCVRIDLKTQPIGFQKNILLVTIPHAREAKQAQTQHKTAFRYTVVLRSL